MSALGGGPLTFPQAKWDQHVVISGSNMSTVNTRSPGDTLITSTCDEIISVFREALTPSQSISRDPGSKQGLLDLSWPAF